MPHSFPKFLISIFSTLCLSILLYLHPRWTAVFPWLIWGYIFQTIANDSQQRATYFKEVLGTLKNFRIMWPVYLFLSALLANLVVAISPKEAISVVGKVFSVAIPVLLCIPLRPYVSEKVKENFCLFALALLILFPLFLAVDLASDFEFSRFFKDRPYFSHGQKSLVVCFIALPWMWRTIYKHFKSYNFLAFFLFSMCVLAHTYSFLTGALCTLFGLIILYGFRHRNYPSLPSFIFVSFIVYIFIFPIAVSLISEELLNKIYPFHKQMTFQIRMLIYKEAMSHYEKLPFLGHGLGIIRSGVYENFSRNAISNGSPILHFHVHNVIIQWWLELGAVGVTLIIPAIRQWIYSFPWKTNTAWSLYLFMIFFNVYSYAFGIWQGWLMGLFASSIIMVHLFGLPFSKRQ